MFFAASLALFFGSMFFQSEKKSFWFLFIAVFFGFYRVRFPILPSYFRNQYNPFQHISVQHFQFNRRLERLFHIFRIHRTDFFGSFETAKLGKVMRFFLYVLLLMSFLCDDVGQFLQQLGCVRCFSLLIFIMALFKKQFSGTRERRGKKNIFFESLCLFWLSLFSLPCFKERPATSTTF